MPRLWETGISEAGAIFVGLPSLGVCRSSYDFLLQMDDLTTIIDILIKRVSGHGCFF